MASTLKWRKILYEDQGFSDNHVDDSFLEELKKNLYTRTYDYWSVVQESGVVTQQLCSVCMFVAVFVFMDTQVLSAETLVYMSTVLLIVGYTINCLLPTRRNNHRKFSDDLKTALIFSGFSYCLSPVLVSLTETIATDTIYAMTTVMLLGNLFFYDYGADAELVSGVLSLNAGLFASVCLASRLHTILHAFTTVTFAVELFALWPVLRRNLKQSIPWLNIVMTTSLTVISIMTLSLISSAAAILLSIVILFVTFICPAWLIHLQPYKNNIHGPWDEAVIKTD